MLNEENHYLFKFAWRSIRRNSGRSFFIGFSVSLAVVIAIWVVSFFHGLNFQIEQAVVNTNTGYFQVQEPLYAKSTDSSQPQELTHELSLVLNRPPIKSFSPELVLDGNISTPEGAAGLLVLGIEPDYHEKFLPIQGHVIEGEYLNSQDNMQTVIGQELARIFKFKAGDQMILNYQDHLGQLRSEILHIKGIFHFSSKSFEKRHIYLNQKTWQHLFLNQETGKILFNRIPLIVNGLEDTPVLEQRFNSTGLNLKSWKNLNPEMAVVLNFHDGMIRFFFLIIGITIVMTIMAPVRMLWQERYPELRMMSILGSSKKKFWKIGLFEIFQMILYSGVISSVFLISIVGIQSRTGIDFEFLNRGVNIERAGIVLPNIVYPKLTAEQLVITFLFIIFILSVSYLWSIYRTLKKFEAEL